MATSTSRDATRNLLQEPPVDITAFPTGSALESQEQRQRFELLRLAFFGLKLRKIDQRLADEQETLQLPEEVRNELIFRRNLLRHVIFQQMVTLIQLDARQQALQIIEACQR